MSKKTAEKTPPTSTKAITRTKKGLNKKKDEFVPEEITKTEDYLVKFTFTQDEINTKAKKMADHNDKINSLQDELTSIKAQYKSKIDGERASFNELIGHVGSGYEYRKMQCLVKMNTPEPGKKSYFLDGNLVENGIEPMLASDFQTVIKFNEAKAEDTDFNIIVHNGVDEIACTNLEQLKKAFLENKLPHTEAIAINGFLEILKRRGNGELNFSEFNTGQTLLQHLIETKNLDNLLLKL